MESSVQIWYYLWVGGKTRKQNQGENRGCELWPPWGDVSLQRVENSLEIRGKPNCSYWHSKQWNYGQSLIRVKWQTGTSESSAQVSKWALDALKMFDTVFLNKLFLYLIFWGDVKFLGNKGNKAGVSIHSEDDWIGMTQGNWQTSYV